MSSEKMTVASPDARSKMPSAVNPSAILSSNISNDQGYLDEPSEEDLITLRRVGDKIPNTAYLVTFFSGCERFAYYALQAPLQNYIQNPRGILERPGALGLGQSWATSLNSFLTLFSYTTPMFAGILADGHWGAYKVIVVSCCVYVCGILVLLLTSIPPSVDAGAGLGGLIGSFILIGLGVGGIKSSVAPFTADQVRGRGKRVVVLKTGERVIVDQEVTVRSIYTLFYWATNLGTLSVLASTFMEKYLGFWAAFLLALVVLCIGSMTFMLGHNIYIRRKPESTIQAKLFSALGCAIKGGFSLDASRPAAQLERHGRIVSWDEPFVEDLRQALRACRVMAAYPIMWLCYNQNLTNLISQAGQMVTYGIPNDAFFVLNPISVLVLSPVIEYWVYPYMHKIKLPPRPTVRMALGFLLVAISMAVAAIVQNVVYNAPPCFDMPLECPASNNGSIPNQTSLMLQIPVHIIGSIGEIFFSVSVSEHAYNKAAPNLKSTLQATMMLTIAVSSALGIAVAPAAHNPNLTILFASFTAVIMATTGVFSWFFWNSE